MLLKQNQQQWNQPSEYYVWRMDNFQNKNIFKIKNLCY
jgi:hypothetical protein